MPEPDDDLDALTWAGDEDRARRGVRTARDDRPGVSGRDDEDSRAGADRSRLESDANVDEPEVAPPGGPVATLVTALGAVVYLALTVGWVLAVQLTAGGTDVVSAVLWQFGEFLAIAAAPLWFVAVQTLVPRRRVGVRAAWLLLGAGLLLPWPLLPTVLS